MRKILVVEDDPMLLEIYQKKFSKVGFQVEIASDGSTAFKKAKELFFDLILLDLVIPEEDGFEVLQKLKSDPDTKDIKVVIFSNLSQQEDRQKAEALGAEGFIVKSDYTPQEVLMKVSSFFDDVKKDDNLEFETKTLNEEGEKEKSEFSEKENNFEVSEIHPMEVKSKELLGNIKDADGKSILIVEDEDVFAEVFGKKLREAGYVVDVATNGAWGLKLLKENSYNLVVLDIVMPAINGFELLEKIEVGSKNHGIPIIVFSNSVEEEERKEEAFEKGASLFLVKTRVTPSELLMEIDKLIC